MSEAQARARKRRHIDVCLTEKVTYSTRSTGLEAFDLPYRALPEGDLAAINLRSRFLGKDLSAPFLIGAMTGGERHAAIINRNLAIAAQELGVGMMLGSQRVMLEHPALTPTFAVREVAPDILLVGNLGVAQLNKGFGRPELTRAVTAVGADALALHTNPLQEAFQPGGDTDFSALIPKLEALIPALPFPVLLKEVGHGISGELARSLGHVGLAAIDVAGAGGTCWAKVESYVRYGELKHLELAEVGISTADALQEVRRALPQTPLIASGGIRSGLDAAKALALGAQVVAVALPLLEPALEGADAVKRYLETFLWELRVAMFAAGAADMAALKGCVLRRR